MLPTLIPKYVRTGKLKIEYHSLETATREPSTFKTQQEAAYAAGKQNKAWYFIETFYHEQLPEEEEDAGGVTESYIQGIAQQVPGLNLADWSTARSEPTYASEVEHDAQAANQAGFTGTPSFELGKTGGTLEKFEPGTFTEAGPVRSGDRKAAEELAGRPAMSSSALRKTMIVAHGDRPLPWPPTSPTSTTPGPPRPARSRATPAARSRNRGTPSSPAFRSR